MYFRFIVNIPKKTLFFFSFFMLMVDHSRLMSTDVDYGQKNSQINHKYVYYHWYKLQGIWMYVRFIVTILKFPKNI